MDITVEASISMGLRGLSSTLSTNSVENLVDIYFCSIFLSLPNLMGSFAQLSATSADSMYAVDEVASRVLIRLGFY